MRLLFLVIITLGHSPNLLANPALAEPQTQQLLEARRLNQEVEGAIPHAERLVSIQERAFGPEDITVVRLLANLADSYCQTARYAQPELRCSRALASSGVTNPQGPEGDQLFRLINQISKLQQAKKEKSAVPLVERALSMAAKTVPPNDPRHIAVLVTAGEVYWKIGDDQKAEPLLKRANQFAEGALELSHPLVFASLVNLALFYREHEDPASSQPLFRKTVALMEKLRGPEHRDVAVFLKLLAESYFQQGDYVSARPIYERVLALLEKLGNTEDRFYVATINDLAEAYSQMGDYVRAATLLNKSIDLKTKIFGPEDPSVANALSNLGTIARTTHNYAQAAIFYQRAADIFAKVHGPDSLEVASVLNQVGLLASDTGDNDRAELILKRALEIREAKLGKDSRHVAETLVNLAWIQFARGKYAEAEPAYLRALEIRQRAGEGKHPELATVLSHLAMLYEAGGHIKKAVAAQKRSNEIAEHNLNLTLAQGSEEQKILYMQMRLSETYGTVSLHLQSAPNDLDAAELAFTTILRRKGRTLDVMSDSLELLRRRLSPADISLLDQLSRTRSKLANISLNPRETDSVELRRATIVELEAEMARLETDISSRSSDFRLLSQPVTLAQVQESLPQGSWLLEFVLYQPFDVRAGNSNAWKAPRYALYLIPRFGPTSWLDLGEAAHIDSEVGRLRAALQDPDRTDVKSIARAIDERLMRPVRKLIGTGRQLFIAPDGALNLMPFAALVDERDRYLIEDSSISYLTSGRDLLRTQLAIQRNSAPTVLAHPLYDLNQNGANTKRLASSSLHQSGRQKDTSRRSLDFTALRYPPLPGTMEEAIAIKAMLPDAQLLVREDATEAAVKRVRSPRVLHIATHGFFLPDQTDDMSLKDRSRQLIKERVKEKNTARLENPLLRSGLVFAGVKQRASGSNDDGVLTALETSALDLAGTKLVVLSACETGLGDVSNGEGVYGLRRALILAGSETQVMSLWQVSDLATRDLMSGYYKRLKAGEGRSEAFRQVQLGMLHTSKFNHPYYWASFIQSGAWTSLDGR
jgi:CHAT domain-containing protein/Tfp pilus assembly protein PilF